MVIRSNTKDRPNHILALAFVSTALTFAVGTDGQAQQPSPQRTQYPRDVVVTENFHSFAGGRVLPTAGDTAALISRLGDPATATRDLGLALMPGLELGRGNTIYLFRTSPPSRADVARPLITSKLMTLHSLSYRGVPLAPGSDVLSIATVAGKLLAVRERNLPQVVDGTNPTVDRDAAIQTAIEASRTHGMPADADARDLHLEVFVDRPARGRLTWRVRVANDSLTAPWAREIWVAAIGNPVVLADHEAIYHSHHGHVATTAFPASPFGGSVSQDLGDAFVIRSGSDGGAVTTDADGRYAFPTGVGVATLIVENRGPFSIVSNVPGGGIVAAADGSPSAPIDLSLNAATEQELAQTTAFVWVNRAHALVQDFLPPSEAPCIFPTPQTPPLLCKVPTNVNIASACNAFWSPSSGSLNFLHAGSFAGRDCPNTAYSDVVLHEYGHAVDQKFGGFLDGSYSEGFGDALAIIGTRQPCVGRDFFGPGTCLRQATDVFLWPPGSNETDPHAIGRRYLGFVWALITELQAEYTPDTSFEITRQLVLGAAFANPSSIPDAVRLSFLADDDDGDLTTCSPHQQMLAAAADSRHIPRPPDCTPSPSIWHPFMSLDDRLATLAVGRNLDGRLEVFGAAGDQTLWHNWQISPNNGWRGWQPFLIPGPAGDKLVTLAVGQNRDGRLEVFGTAADDTIWHNWQTSANNGWSGWQPFMSLDDRLVTLVVGRNLDGRLEVFGAASDQTLWHNWQISPNNGWSGWQPFLIPGPAGDKLVTLAVGQNRDGRLEVFGTAADDTIWHNWQTSANNGWSGWQPFMSLDDRLVNLAVGRNADGRLEVFGAARDQTLWHNWQTSPNNGWSGWQPFIALDHKLVTLAVGQNADGRLEVFGTAPDDTIWHNWQITPNFSSNNGWSGWQPFTTLADRLVTLAVAVNADGRLEVFGAARDQTLWHAWQITPNNGWAR
jgi:hypothetical protein